MTEEKLLHRRNFVGSIHVEKGEASVMSDNLAIVLCSYFEGHVDRPEYDEIDPDKGWSKWALQKTDEALDIIAAELMP